MRKQHVGGWRRSWCILEGVTFGFGEGLRVWIELVKYGLPVLLFLSPGDVLHFGFPLVLLLSTQKSFPFPTKEEKIFLNPIFPFLFPFSFFPRRLFIIKVAKSLVKHFLVYFKCSVRCFCNCFRVIGTRKNNVCYLNNEMYGWRICDELSLSFGLGESKRTVARLRKVLGFDAVR